MVVSTDKSMAVLTHQTTGTGKSWKPGQALALNEKSQFKFKLPKHPITCPRLESGSVAH